MPIADSASHLCEIMDKTLVYNNRMHGEWNVPRMLFCALDISQHK